MNSTPGTVGITDYTVIKGRSLGFFALLACLAAVMAAGLWGAHQMETQGHAITGMTNQIAWGIPHVLAIFLIVTASGSLNGATLSSVLGQKMYTPYARLSGLLAVALLLGGLAVISLDLGRPERLAVALFNFNFKSVFAWNVPLYTGFMGLTAFYLWTHMERRMNRFSKPVGLFLLLWRFILTTGTGLIFGVLVAREAYDTAIMAPMFIAMSLSFGTAAYILLLLAAFGWTGRPLEDAVVMGLKRLLIFFIALVLYLVLVFHTVKFYAAGFHGVERFLLVDGGIITGLFWAGQILAGSLLPLWLMVWRRTATSRLWTAVASVLVLLGGIVQVYVIVIGGQAFPRRIFPGKEIIESSFYDGVVSSYHPSMPEFLLSIGGIAMAMLIIVLSLKVLQFLPQARTGD